MRINIIVKNWEKYQIRRTDVKRNSWFRFENQFFFDHNTFELSGDDIKAYLYCLCETSRKGQGHFDTSLDFICKTLRFDKKKMIEILNDLSSIGFIRYEDVTSTLRERNVDVSYITEHNITEQDTGTIANAPVTTAPRIFEIWNENRGRLSEAKALSKQRAQSVKARWAENPSEQYWVSVVARVAASDFCNGNNKQNWWAEFDWLIKPDTHLRVLEGKYDNKKPATAEKLVFKEPKKFGEK